MCHRQAGGDCGTSGACRAGAVKAIGRGNGCDDFRDGDCLGEGLRGSEGSGH